MVLQGAGAATFRPDVGTAGGSGVTLGPASPEQAPATAYPPGGKGIAVRFPTEPTITTVFKEAYVSSNNVACRPVFFEFPLRSSLALKLESPIAFIVHHIILLIKTMQVEGEEVLELLGLRRRTRNGLKKLNTINSSSFQEK